MHQFNYLGKVLGAVDVRLCVCVCVLSYMRLFVALWTVACQAPLSMGFSKQESGVGCHALL